MLYESYEYGGHNEHILTALPVDDTDDALNRGASPHILFIPPLFAEMNKMRQTLVQSMRILADNGIKASLADLPGCHESIVSLHDQSLSDWNSAMISCANQHDITHIASFRGGALIDDLSRPTWRLNSVKGINIVKTMLRSKVISSKEAGHDITIDQLIETANSSGIELAGYDIGAKMFNALQIAEPSISDTIFEAKTGQHIEGGSLWLRSEPEYDVAMAISLAEKLSLWCQTRHNAS